MGKRSFIKKLDQQRVASNNSQRIVDSKPSKVIVNFTRVTTEELKQTRIPVYEYIL